MRNNWRSITAPEVAEALECPTPAATAVLDAALKDGRLVRSGAIYTS